MEEPREEPKYAQVILDLVSDALDRPFQYMIPAGLRKKLKPGWRVLVPFRAGKLEGYVVQTGTEAMVEAPREILKLQDPYPILTPEQVELSSWLAEHFFSRWIEAIRLCLPPATGRVKPKFQEYVFPARNIAELLNESAKIKNRAPRQALILEHLALSGKGGATWKELRDKTGAGRQSLLSLVEKGFLQLERLPLERIPWNNNSLISSLEGAKLSFSEEQEKAWGQIEAAFSSPQKHFLIHGVSGSGKTELYLRTAEEVIKKGRTVLILVPEIALAPQMIAQFGGRFRDRFALLHSSLSPGERYDQWWMAKRGEARVVLGARSAIFAPLENIGLIVVDEEHENTYKQGETPRYHTLEVAGWRAKYHDAFLLQGSATPSLESYWKARHRDLKLLTLKERVAARPLPAVQVVDMRREFKDKNRSIFSRKLLTAMKDTISRGEQVILFLNRRGFAGFQLCRECGYVVQCPSCAVSMTYHISPEHLQCHFCGFKKAVLRQCPQCKSGYIRNFGLGTQRVEKEMKNIFPEVDIIRMDSDSTTGKEAHLKMWSAFQQQKASVLIGTQMVAKGLDFPAVTLVGVIAADLTLHLPDFRSGERTFQLLTQVAGRAGRGEKEGEVIIQTYTPWHYTIRAAKAHDYHEFLKEELQRRQKLLYPPFTDIILFNCSAPQEAGAKQAAAGLKRKLDLHLLPVTKGKGEILGPFPAPLPKIKGYYRHQILFKGENLQQYNSIIRKVVWDFRIEMGSDSRITVDFNPMIML